MFTLTAKVRSLELNIKEWEQICSTDAFLTFRRNCIVLEAAYVSHESFYPVVIETMKEVRTFLREHCDDLWFIEGTDSDRTRKVFFASKNNAMEFRVRFDGAQKHLD